MNKKIQKHKYTSLGIITILIWGTSAAFTRNLSTGIGAYTSAAIVNIIGGIIVLISQSINKGGLKDAKKVTKWYWPICGGLFIIYTATSYLSMSIVTGEEAVMTLVLIRFLWPLFTLILTIPILHMKASPWLIVGVVISFIGITVANMGNNGIGIKSIISNFMDGENLSAYMLGFVVSLSWGFYTNLTKKFVKEMNVDGSGIFMLLSGLILGALSYGMDEPRAFSSSLVGQIIYAAIIVSSLANVMWNLSIRKGNMLIVVLISNFLPIISIIITAILLGYKITIPHILGATLVVLGTIWSKKCF